MAPTAEAAARVAADLIAGRLRDAIAERGTATLALSGGRTPARMVELLAGEPLEWERVHLFQVDERVVPRDDPDLNWRTFTPLLSRLSPGTAHPVPMMSSANDLEPVVAEYAQALADVAGRPAVLDMVHLGLGDDGHTASLVPGDPAVDVIDQDVVATGSYRGHRRVTLPRGVLVRARAVVWLVVGADKAAMAERLLRGDPSIVAGRVDNPNAFLVTDTAAAATPSQTG